MVLTFLVLSTCAMHARREKNEEKMLTRASKLECGMYNNLRTGKIYVQK